MQVAAGSRCDPSGASEETGTPKRFQRMRAPAVSPGSGGRCDWAWPRCAQTPGSLRRPGTAWRRPNRMPTLSPAPLCASAVSQTRNCNLTAASAAVAVRPRHPSRCLPDEVGGGHNLSATSSLDRIRFRRSARARVRKAAVDRHHLMGLTGAIQNGEPSGLPSAAPETATSPSARRLHSGGQRTGPRKTLHPRCPPPRSKVTAPADYPVWAPD